MRLTEALCPAVSRGLIFRRLAWMLTLLLSVVVAVVSAQQPVFELQVPDFSERFFDGNVIEVPIWNPSSLSFRLLNPVAQDVDYGRIHTMVNGLSAGYVTTLSNSAEGKVGRINLRLRAGMSLVPGTNSIEVIAVNRRGRKFYRNFVLKTKEHSRNEYFAYESNQAQADNVGAPPDIMVLEPEFPVLLEAEEQQRRVRLLGSVTAIHPLDYVRVNHEFWKDPGTVLKLDHHFTVRPGDGNVTVEAVDRMGNRASVMIPVEVSTSTIPIQGGGERYALVVGISRYASRDAVPSLCCSALDARQFAATLNQLPGWKRENVYVLTDADASSAQLRNAFRNFVTRAGPDDLLLVYFSGYGLHDPTNPEKLYLLGHESQMGLLADTALSLEELQSILAESIRARQALLLFDVARSLEGEWAAAYNNLVHDYLLRLFPGDSDRIVMVGTGLAEAAREESGVGGIFARQLIAGARGAADVNRDRVVTAREWFQFVKSSVRRDSEGSQNPQYVTQPLDVGFFTAQR